MRRLLILAIGLSALLWTVAAMSGVGNVASPDVASGFSRTNVASGFSPTNVASGFSRTNVASGFSRTNVASGFHVHRSLDEGGSRTSATADPDGPSQADLKWRTQQHTIGVVTESIWKSALVHVELGATRAAHSSDTVLAFSSPDPPLSSVPHYLRHTPLLI